jgi:hypothetical protein
MNLMMHMKELLKLCRSRRRRNQITLKFPPLFTEAIIMFLLNYHVVHDHTSSIKIEAEFHTSKWAGQMAEQVVGATGFLACLSLRPV